MVALEAESACRPDGRPHLQQERHPAGSCGAGHRSGIFQPSHSPNGAVADSLDGTKAAFRAAWGRQRPLGPPRSSNKRRAHARPERRGGRSGGSYATSALFDRQNRVARDGRRRHAAAIRFCKMRCKQVVLIGDMWIVHPLSILANSAPSAKGGVTISSDLLTYRAQSVRSRCPFSGLGPPRRRSCA